MFRRCPTAPSRPSPGRAVALGVCALACAACGSTNTGFASPYGPGGSKETPASAAGAEGGPAPLGTQGTEGPEPDAAILEEGGDDEGGSTRGGSGRADAAGGTGDAGAPLVTFTLVNASFTGVATGLPVTGFDPIAPGAHIDLAESGAVLSIVATTTPAVVGSLLFALDGTAYTHTEESAPYSLCGDDGAGTFTVCALGVGEHTLVATEYKDPGLAGGASAPTTLKFTIFDSADGGSDGGVVIKP